MSKTITCIVSAKYDIKVAMMDSYDWKTGIHALLRALYVL